MQLSAQIFWVTALNIFESGGEGCHLSEQSTYI